MFISIDNGRSQWKTKPIISYCAVGWSDGCREWYNKHNINLMANSPRDLNIAGFVELVQEFTLPLESLGFPTFTLLFFSFLWLQPWASCLPCQSCLTERMPLFSHLLAAAGGQAGTCIHVWRHKKGNLPSQCPFPPAPMHSSKYFSVHVCKGMGGSSGVTIDLYHPTTPDPGSHAVTQEPLVMLCVQSRCPRLLSPACGVPSAPPEAKPVVSVEVYLVAFILHPSITAPFEHLLGTIKRKE